MRASTHTVRARHAALWRCWRSAAQQQGRWRAAAGRPDGALPVPADGRAHRPVDAAQRVVGVPADAAGVAALCRAAHAQRRPAGARARPRGVVNSLRFDVLLLFVCVWHLPPTTIVRASAQVFDPGILLVTLPFAPSPPSTPHSAAATSARGSSRASGCCCARATRLPPRPAAPSSRSRSAGATSSASTTRRGSWRTRASCSRRGASPSASSRR